MLAQDNQDIIASIAIEKEMKDAYTEKHINVDKISIPYLDFKTSTSSFYQLGNNYISSFTFR